MKRLVAILIALLFLGAIAQCDAVCVQPVQKNLPPCHQHAATCTKAPLTAEKVTAATMPAPMVSFLPLQFVTPLHLQIGWLASPPRLRTNIRKTVLLI